MSFIALAACSATTAPTSGADSPVHPSTETFTDTSAPVDPTTSMTDSGRTQSSAALMTWEALPDLPDPDVYAVVLGPNVHTFQRMFSTHYQLAPSDTAPTWYQNLTPPSGLAFRTAGSVYDVLYLVGGSIGSEPQKEALVRSDTTWEQSTPMLHGRWGAVAEEVAGKLYVLGGSTGVELADYLVAGYDPADDRWFEPASVPADNPLSLLVSHTSAAVLHDQLYLYTSRKAPVATAALRYDPMMDVWEQLPDLPGGLHRPGVAALDGLIFLLGGERDATPLDEIVTFDPTGDTYSEPVATLPVPLVHPTVVALKGCLVVLGGDYDVDGQDPSSAAWRGCPSARGR